MRKFVLTLGLSVSLSLLALTAQAGVYDDTLKAVIENNTAELTTLLNRGVDPDTADADGNTLLMISARSGNAAQVELLILRRAKVQARNRFGDDALLQAAFKGHLPVLKLLLAAGAQVNRSQGWQPLTYAAFNGHLEVMRYLLEQGADVNGASDNGTTALMVAARNGHLDAVKLLLAHKAEPDKINDAAGTALKWAKAAGNTDIVELLEKAGALLE